jgi:hypothetical protein
MNEVERLAIELSNVPHTSGWHMRDVAKHVLKLQIEARIDELNQIKNMMPDYYEMRLRQLKEVNDGS